jgi:hypothetical protein
LSLRGATEPHFPIRGARTLPVRREWFSHGGSKFDSLDRMDRNFDRRGRMDVTNPTLKEIAQHCFHTFGINTVLSRLLALSLGSEL